MTPEFGTDFRRLLQSLMPMLGSPGADVGVGDFRRRFLAAGGTIESLKGGLLALRSPEGQRVVVQTGPVPETSAEVLAYLPTVDTDPVPHAAIANARRIRAARRDLLESGAFNYSALAEGRDSTIDATRHFVSRAQRRQLLFTVEHDGSTWVPAFLLDEALDPIPAFAGVLAELVGAGSSAWAMWRWLVSPSGWLDGAVPAEVMRSDPGAVLDAARARTANAA